MEFKRQPQGSCTRNSPADADGARFFGAAVQEAARQMLMMLASLGQLCKEQPS